MASSSLPAEAEAKQQLASDSVSTTATSTSKTASQEAPKELCCPITGLLFKDPVVTVLETTYDRKAIEAYWRTGVHRDPLTNLDVADLRLTSNSAVRCAVDEFLAANPGYATDWSSSSVIERLPDAEDDADASIGGRWRRCTRQDLVLGCVQIVLLAFLPLSLLLLFQPWKGLQAAQFAGSAASVPCPTHCLEILDEYTCASCSQDLFCQWDRGSHGICKPLSDLESLGAFGV